MFTYNGQIITNNGNWLRGSVTPPHPDYNPLNLPANTMRVRTTDGEVPFKHSASGDTTTSYETATLVSGTSDVYDVYKSGTDLSFLLYKSSNVAEVLGANTEGVTNMSHMFECDSNSPSSLTTVALFDTSSVTNMSDMFGGTKVSTIPLYDTSNVLFMNNMFVMCDNLTTIPLLNTSSVRNTYGLFTDCINLTSVPLLDLSSVLNMKYMFSHCIRLTEVPLFNTHNVTNMDASFLGCRALTNIPLFDVTNVTSAVSTFADCVCVQSGAYNLYSQLSSKSISVTSHSRTFYNCGDNSNIPSDWK